LRNASETVNGSASFAQTCVDLLLQAIGLSTTDASRASFISTFTVLAVSPASDLQPQLQLLEAGVLLHRLLATG
jgi:hypothetical protein